MSNDKELLFDIFNDINITLINTNLSIKDKVIKKIKIIKTLSNSNIDVLNYNNDKKKNLFFILKSINNKLMSVQKKQNQLTSKLNNILGILIHNAYTSNDYHIIMSNVPNVAKQIIDNKINIIDVETIHDTLVHYSGKDTVLNVIKIDNDKYLIKFKDINDARKICQLINKMMIDPNIIRVEMLEKTENLDNVQDDNEHDNENENEHDNDNENDNEHDNENDNVNKLNKSSLFRICIDLAYTKYKNIHEKIKNNINYILSFFL